MNAPDKKLLTDAAERRQKEDLVRRFVSLPLERRRHFLTRLSEQGIDFSLLPIPTGLAGTDDVPLSFAQQRLWFLSRLDPDSTAYHMTGGLHVRGQLQADAVRAAFANIQTRHAALRTTFHETDGQAVQCIHELQALPYRELDFTNDQALDDIALRALAEAEARMPFDLEQGPLWRLTLVRLSDSEYEIWLSLHHIIADGWSLNRLMHEFSELYKADLSSPKHGIETARITYGDYAIWQRAWLEAGEADRQLAYWLSCLEGEQPLLHLPEDHSRPVTPSNRGGRVPFSCDEQLTGELRELARKQGMTLFNILLAAFLIVLYRYSGQHDLRVGIPLANRDRSEIDRVIGFFVNTVVIRIPIQGRLSVHELLHAVRTAMIDAQAHPDLPFDQLVDALPHERSLDRNPLFQVMYNHQQRAYDALSIPGLEVLPIDRDAGGAQLDLSLDTEELGTALQGVFTYALDLFERSTIQRLAHHWQRVLAAMVKNPLQRIAEVPLLDEVEAHRILEEWNNTTVDYTKEVYFHMLFEAQAARTPEATALIFPEGEREQRLTYAQLNTRANRLAHRLQSMGVGPDVLVGIAVERSIEMVIGLLAIFKAGGAYVPLDPEYPAERLGYMMTDSGIDLLLTQEQLQARLSIPHGVQILYLDGESEADWHQESAENLPLIIQPDNLAYVIYTSGSTGKPKGVCISIQSLTQHIFTSINMFGLTSTDRVLQFSTYNFDAFIEQLYPALCCGASIIIRGKNIWGSDEFYQQLITQSITVVDLPTQYWYQLVRDFSAYQFFDYGALRQMNAGGEALPADGLQIWHQAHLSHVRLLNTYGPTEATVTATVLDCSNAVSGNDKPIVPIGRPLGGRCCYLLDEDLNPAPIGRISELYLGGIGLARGYHRRPALTAERFVPNPYGEPGSRLYRTGDLVRYRLDGNIEYVGRIDHQLKIRGFRIELGEIESQLQAQVGVRNAVVLAQAGTGGQQQLVAYVVPIESDLIEVNAEVQNTFRSALKSQLQAALPEYMVPAHYVLLASLPLTPNGKLDRKALPAVEVAAFQGIYEAPRTKLQRQLAQVWQSVLGIEQVGLNDNFFELGGDSIISLQVVSRARQQGIHFAPKDIFQHQTLAGLVTIAKEIKQGMQIEQGPVKGMLPLMPIQRWFFEERIPERHHWNQSVLLKPSEPLQAMTLQTALEYLLLHHDALRLSFTEMAGQGWQSVFLAPEQVNKDLLWQRSISGVEALEGLCTEAQRSLDLGQGPLLRAVLADLPEGEQRLLLVIHHLVVDGVSWRVLLEDLQTAYRQTQSGQAIRLPAKTDSVRTWSERLHQYARNDVLQQELGYWQTELTKAQGDLPRDNIEGSLQNKHARRAVTHLDKTWTERLLKEAPAAYRTQINDLLLTALARVIARWIRQSSVLIQLEGHGREELFEDIDLTRTIGWFTTVYPIRLNPVESLDVSIKTIKEQLRKVPNKGIGFGVLRYLGDESIQQQLRGLSEPRITFNYLGQFDSSFDAREGLFSPTGDGKGAGQSPEAPLDNWLSIDGQVYNGELKLGWTFSGDMYAEATIQGLADAYAEELQALIGHCCSKENNAVTPSDFPLVHLTQAQLDALPVAATEIDDIYPLSPMQQGMLFHSLSAPEEGAYLNQLRVDIRGLDVERFRKAWQSTLDQHAILRAGFIWEGLEEPLQVIRRQVALPIQLRDWRKQIEAGYSDGLKDALEQLAQERLQTGFALNVAPLLRLDLVRVADDGYHMIYTNHHVLMDGWSDSQLLGEVLQRYYQGQVPVAAAAAGSYRDYLVWLQHRDPVAQERFWRAQLKALEEPTLLANAVGNAPVQSPESPQTEAVWGDYSATLTEEEVSRLSGFTRQQKVTVNTVLQAAWLLLLQRYTGQDCVSFGATVAGRPAEVPGIEQQLGLFINTLPVVGRIDPTENVGDWVRRVQVQNLALREYEHTPLYEIQRWAGQAGNALFDNIIVFENYPVAEALRKGAPPGLEFGEIRHHEQTNYGLTLQVSLSDHLRLHYRYDRRQFPDAVVEQLNRQLIGLLKAFIRNADQAVGNLSLLNEGEAHHILKEWNDTVVNYGEDACIHSLFEAQVAKTPKATALIFTQEGYEQSLTYAELNTRANRLAHRLRSLGVGPDILVGIAVERSIEMVVGLLGILKAGGAYVPLDPEYPAERLSYMMTDSGIALLLTQEQLQERLPIPEGIQVLYLSGESAEIGEERDSDENLSLAANSDNLTYMIYTSGSTGKPKGVAVAHRGVANLLFSMAGQLGIGADDRMLGLTSLSFDIAALELYLPLISGAAIALLDSGASKDPQIIIEAVKRTNTTHIQATPSTWKMLVETEEATFFSRCKLLVGGEALSDKLAEALLERSDHFWNVYGPTETTIWSASYRLDRMCKQPYLGKPLANTTTHILDHELCPQPVGIIGELYIGGIGLARGYHGRPGLTAERFIPDPYGEAGGRLYRTGDLARYRPDGNVEYIGRIDHQVKIRGFRIELGEIESQLQAQVGIRDAVVLAQIGSSGQQLVAYVVPAEGSLIEAEAEIQNTFRSALKSQLHAVLPEYMVPAQYVLLASLPLTPNGKLDRKALPAADWTGKARNPPETEWERKLAQLWQEILGIEQIGWIGREDSFFDLGGHSLLAMRLVAKLKSACQLDLSIRDVFEHPTLAAQAEVLQTLSESHAGGHDLMSDLADAFAELQAMSPEQLEDLAGPQEALSESGQSDSPIYPINNNQ